MKLFLYITKASGYPPLKKSEFSLTWFRRYKFSKTKMFPDQEYTVFVPTDHAFQRWHPIDWGFYPFSVPEFTESVIENHFVQGRLKQDTIKDGQVVRTLGGRDILFKRTRRYFSTSPVCFFSASKGNLLSPHLNGPNVSIFLVFVPELP